MTIIKTNFNDLITGTLLLLSNLFTLLRESQHQWCAKNRWGGGLISSIHIRLLHLPLKFVIVLKLKKSKKNPKGRYDGYTHMMQIRSTWKDHHLNFIIIIIHRCQCKEEFSLDLFWCQCGQLKASKIMICLYCPLECFFSLLCSSKVACSHQNWLVCMGNHMSLSAVDNRCARINLWLTSKVLVCWYVLRQSKCRNCCYTLHLTTLLQVCL